MSTGGVARPDRHALLELGAVLAKIEELSRAGDRHRFDTDDQYRWVLHRLWIAAGNEAYAYAKLRSLNIQVDQPWAVLYRQRNALAHERLPDIDEDGVWRTTQLRTATFRRQVRALLR